MALIITNIKKNFTCQIWQVKKSDFNIALGKTIKEVRTALQLSQLDVASKIDGEFDTTNLSRIESGRIATTVYTLDRICRAMGISLEDFFKTHSQLK
ncbi:helix-turn-helix domain-containing protein [Flavobacterium sp.]|uniref:helix-turn-helix domain-containing protein n=1 Tax=Flavobacterium sp. TaxID=239 RepID=UPI003B9BD7C7